MADAADKQILDVIVTRLQNITKDNGYDFDIGEVAEADRDRSKWRPQQNSILINLPEQEYLPELSCPGAEFRPAYNMPIEIYGFCRRLDRDTSEIGIPDEDVTESAMRAAITKAITNSDPSGWHTFGFSGMIMADFVMKSRFDEPGWEGAKVDLAVQYRVKETDHTVFA